MPETCSHVHGHICTQKPTPIHTNTQTQQPPTHPHTHTHLCTHNQSASGYHFAAAAFRAQPRKAPEVGRTWGEEPQALAISRALRPFCNRDGSSETPVLRTPECLVQVQFAANYQRCKLKLQPIPGRERLASRIVSFAALLPSESESDTWWYPWFCCEHINRANFSDHHDSRLLSQNIIPCRAGNHV